MAISAGQRITAARLLNDSDFTTLTDDTAAAANTWEDWATETITFTNPGVAVKVSAVLNGRVNNATDASTTATWRIAISFDGGSTFTTSTPPTALAQVGTGSGAAQRFPVAASFHRDGTPTGNVVIKAQLQTSDTTTTFTNGSLLAQIAAE